MARGADTPDLSGGAPLGGVGVAWLVVVLESAALVVLGALWAAPSVFANQPPAAWAMWAALGLLIVELLTLLLIPRVRAGLGACRTSHPMPDAGSARPRRNRRSCRLTQISSLSISLSIAPMPIRAPASRALKDPPIRFRLIRNASKKV